MHHSSRCKWATMSEYRATIFPSFRCVFRRASSARQSMRKASCSSRGTRFRNGFTALMASEKDDTFFLLGFIFQLRILVILLSVLGWTMIYDDEPLTCGCFGGLDFMGSCADGDRKELLYFIDNVAQMEI